MSKKVPLSQKSKLEIEPSKYTSRWRGLPHITHYSNIIVGSTWCDETMSNL